MNLCPILKNKQVKQEWDEIIATFERLGEDHGSAEASTYYYWNLANGESIYENETYNTMLSLGKESALECAILEAIYKDAGTFMLAPNGEPTKLTKEQWLEVRTKAFKDWFGDWELDPLIASKVTDKNGEPKIVYRGSENDIQYDDGKYMYFSDSRGDASIYQKGLFTKGGQFFARHNSEIGAIQDYIKQKLGIDFIDVDLALDILLESPQSGEPIYEGELLGNGVVVPKIVGEIPHKSIYSEKLIRDAQIAYDLYSGKIENETVNDLYRIAQLLDSTTLRTESDLMRLYDDEYYIRDREELNVLLNKYEDFINNLNVSEEGVVDEVFLDIKNPYTDEINSEDLVSNRSAYKNGHDGAFLMGGEHFLVKNVSLTRKVISLDKKRNRTINNSYLTATEIRDILNYLLDLPKNKRRPGTMIVETSSGRIFKINAAPQFWHHKDNMKDKGYHGFEAIHELNKNGSIKKPSTGIQLQKNDDFFDFDLINSKRLTLQDLQEYSLEEIKDLFNESGNPLPDESKFLSDAIFNTAKKLGIKFKAVRKSKLGVEGKYTGQYVYLNTRADATDILHETIHAVVAYYTMMPKRQREQLPADVQNAIQSLRSIYIQFAKADKEAIKDGSRPYGMSDFQEFIAELSNPNFLRYLARQELKINASKPKKGIVRRIFEAVAKFFGIKSKSLTELAFRDLRKLVVNENKNIFDRFVAERGDEGVALYKKKSAEDAVQESVVILSELFKQYKQTPNKSAKKDQVQNELFETITKLKQQKNTSDQIDILVDYMVDRIGVQSDSVLDVNGEYVRIPVGYDVSNPDTHTKDIYSTLFTASLNDFDKIGTRELTVDIVVDMYKNALSTFGMIRDNISEIQSSAQLSSESNKKLKELSTSINECMSLWKQALYVTTDKLVDDYVERYVTKEGNTVSYDENGNEISTPIKEAIKVNMKDWLHANIVHGNINMIRAYLENYGYAKNPITRMGFHMIQEADQKTLEETTPIVNQLNKVYSKAAPLWSGSWQTIYMEHDLSGAPTGYFVRNRNYGQYQQDKTAEVERLIERWDTDYGYHFVQDSTGQWVRSDNGEPIQDQEWGNSGIDSDDMPMWYKYKLEQEWWISEHADKRYTYNYYQERMSRPMVTIAAPGMTPQQLDPNNHGLSPATLAKYDRIQEQINYYLDKCYDSDIMASRPEKLSRIDKAKYDQWQKAMQELKSPFQENGDPKPIDEFNAAMEIRAWESWLGKQTEAIKDMESFETEYNRLLATDPALANDFLKYNSVPGMHPEFQQLTLGMLSPKAQTFIKERLIRSALSDVVATSNDDRRASIAANGGNDHPMFTRDLSKMESNLQFFIRFKAMDEAIGSVYSKGTKEDVKILDQFKDVELTYQDPNGDFRDKFGNRVDKADVASGKYGLAQLMNWQEYLIDKFAEEASTTGQLLLGTDPATGAPIIMRFTVGDKIAAAATIQLQFFTYEKMTKDKFGNDVKKRVPLSIFSVFWPKNNTFVDSSGRTQKTMTNVPTGRFSEKYNSTGTPYVNQNYDSTVGESEIPNEYWYDNQAEYDKVRGDRAKSALYDKLIDVMQQSQQLYSTNAKFNYKLPLINASNAAILSRIKKLGAKKTGQLLWESMTAILENDLDMNVNKSSYVNPDGTPGFDVPIKFVHDLEDPGTITSDITGATMLYAYMAHNYKNSKEIQSKLEALMYSQMDETRDVPLNEYGYKDNSNNREQFRQMLLAHFSKNEMRVNDPDSKAEVATQKAFKNAMRMGSVYMLGNNYLSILTGLLDSSGAIFEEAIVGQAMTMRDFITAFADLHLHIPALLYNIGDTKPHNKVTAMMLRFGISKSFEAVHLGNNQSRLRKFFGNLLMGGFGFFDYFTTAIATRAYFNNCRFYNGGDFEPGFYTKYEMEQLYIKSGMSAPKAKIKAWMTHMSCMNTLWGAYEFKDGDIRIKDGYKEFLDEDTIKSKLSGSDQKKRLDSAIRTKTNVRSKAIQKGALSAGVNPDNDSPRYRSHILGLLMAAMRGWMTQRVQHEWSGTDDVSVKNVSKNSKTKVKGQRVTSKDALNISSTTTDQKADRMAWNWETGLPMTESSAAMIRAAYTFMHNAAAVIAKVFTGGKLGKFRKLSDVEYTGLKYTAAWLIHAAILIQSANGFLNYAANNAPEPVAYTTSQNPKSHQTTNRALARQLSGERYPWQKQYYELGQWSLQGAATTVRALDGTISEKNMIDMLDFVTSMTVYNTPGKTVPQAMYGYFFEDKISGKGNDVIKNGKYKNFTYNEKWEYQLGVPLMMNNLHTAFSYYGTAGNIDFFLKKNQFTFGKLGLKSSLKQYRNEQPKPSGSSTNAKPRDLYDDSVDIPDDAIGGEALDIPSDALDI